jgi:predicted GIY-YIG superfamily endonuclease
MASMTVEERTLDFIRKASVHGGKLSDYFCGMTNNVARRSKEHGNVSIICKTNCDTKKTAYNLMNQLKKAGFDVDPDILSGQDDSINVYVYKKTRLSAEQLKRTVEITFGNRGYTEEEIGDIPEMKGIYACFACDKELRNSKYQNLELKYIGMTEDGFRTRIQKHKDEDHPDWKKRIKSTQQLIYVIAEFNNEILQSVEAALIYSNQPPENSEYKDGYQGEYHTLTVNCKGAHSTIHETNTATFKG